MSRRLGSGPAADLVAVLGTLLVLGALGGLAWSLLVDPAHLVRTQAGVSAPSELDLSKRFNADGWYSVIAIVAGFLGGLGLTWWRSRDFLLTTLLLLPGAALAAWTMTVVGQALGPGDPRAALSQAERGELVPMDLVVTAEATYLTWPVGVLLGALMVLWSSPRMPYDAQDEHNPQPWPQAAADPFRPPTEHPERSGL